MGQESIKKTQKKSFMLDNILIGDFYIVFPTTQIKYILTFLLSQQEWFDKHKSVEHIHLETNLTSGPWIPHNNQSQKNKFPSCLAKGSLFQNKNYNANKNFCGSGSQNYNKGS